MAFDERIALRCRLSRGGFSSERVIRLSQAGGDTFIGVAPRDYCFTEQGRPLGPDEPGAGEQMRGLVAARRLHGDAGEGTVLVTVPDGSVLSVAPELITRRPAEVVPDVPVQP